MTADVRMRWVLVGFGALAGAVLWALIEMGERDLLPNRVALVLFAGALGFFASALMMMGPLRGPRAVLGAAGIGAAALVLMLLVSLRFDVVEGVFSTPYAVMALMIVVAVPVPFLIAADGPGWRDYPALFEGSWSVVVRGSAALVFLGVIWAVIGLSNELMGIVGVGLIGTWAWWGATPWLISGAGFGLGLAVVWELSDLISARLVVRMLRLLSPVVLAVSVVFVVLAPVQGLSDLVRGYSAAGTLIAMAIAALVLVTLVVDSDDAQAPDSRVLAWAARGLAVVMPVLGGLALWAVWVRVGQYGWTPDRLFAGLTSLVLLAYGVLHAGAVLRGEGWMARIRRVNLGMALVVVGLAALWMTPVMNAERMSARSMGARAMAGGAMSADDLWALEGWGRAGFAVIAELEAAADGGREDLAAWLAGTTGDAAEADTSALRAEVAAVLPLQPASATGTRDSFLMLMPIHQLEAIRDACGRVMAGGQPGCVMVVADMVPQMPGEEVALGLAYDSWATLEGLYLLDGTVVSKPLQTADGRVLGDVEIRRRMVDWQLAPPPMARADLNQLGTGNDGVFLGP